jgi:predicted nucleic acid-binding protein
MVYVLDTDVVSNLSKQAPNRALLEWIAGTPPEEMRIPLAVVFELLMGVEGLINERKTERARELSAWLDALLDAYRDQVDAPDVEVARLQAKLFSSPALRGFLQPHPKSPKLKFDVDLIVAATAIARDAAIVSFNVSDYERIHRHFPLPGLYHPGRAEWVVGDRHRAPR